MKIKKLRFKKLDNPLMESYGIKWWIADTVFRRYVIQYQPYAKRYVVSEDWTLDINYCACVLSGQAAHSLKDAKNTAQKNFEEKVCKVMHDYVVP
jgi:hypothetical protein